MNNLYVADTHALLWYMLKPALLCLAAQHALRQVEYGEAKLHIPLITIAEAEMVIEKRRIQATRSQFERLLQKMMASRNFRVGQLNLDIVLSAAQLTQLSDIFDRLIVAEAQAVNAPLLTRDAEITASNLIPIIW
jgi:PIN domain nuclease of toxin-antitoxin system